MIEFAGWELPVRYSDVRAEHMAVRSKAGAFDVSHMGQLQAVRPEAADLLQRGLTNDISAIPLGGAQYSLICREDGGVLDDVFAYRLSADRFLLVVNAANRERDFRWLSDLARGFDVELSDRSDEFAMIAVQGPRAPAAVARLADGELPSRITVAGTSLVGGGELASGSLSPCLDSGIGLAYVPADCATIGERLEIDVRGRIRAATVQAKPSVPKRG
jgi:aminomethyltransferase